MKAVMCLLLFLILTVEDPATFAAGHWHTVMVYAAPLFNTHPVSVGDVLVGLVILVGAARPARWREQVWPLNLALLASGAMLLGLAAWGTLRGGNPRMAYFQLSGLLRLFLLFPAVALTFRSRRGLLLLAGTVLAAALYRAFACFLGHRFFLRNVASIRFPEYVTDHHDSVLWTIVVIGLMAWLLSRPHPRTLLLVTALSLPILLAIHYNDRRLAWVQLAGGLALIYLVTPRGRLRRRINRWTMMAIPVLALYCVVGWGRSGAVFAPVRQLRSVFDTQGDESNTYRDLENAGLIVTLQGSHMLGTGFGHGFQEISDRYSRGMAKVWSEYRFMPHNSILGLASVAGLIGFPVIWAFVPTGAFLSARARARATRRLDGVLATVAFAYPWVYGVQAFGDMGLQSVKANVLFACTLAMAARLAVLTGAWPSGARSRGTATSDVVLAPANDALNEAPRLPPGRTPQS